jgi:predicted phage tail protein
VPAAPSNLVATAASSSQINLTWTDNANNETSFTIQRATNANFTGATNLTVGANVTSYNDTGRTANTTYYYRVRAVNAVGNSAWSNTASATTLVAAGAPLAPSNFVGTSVNNGATASINMTWVDNANNETRFVLQGADNAAFTAGLVTWNLAANTTTSGDTGLGHGVSYYYRIRAENASGVSAWVNLVPFPITTP